MEPEGLPDREPQDRDTPASPIAAPPAPVLVSTAVTYCITHGVTDHDDDRAWTACRFRQLFYFENPMDEHTLLWSDEIATRGVSDA